MKLSRTNGAIISILFFVVVGSWLRVWAIGRNDLWFDEAFSRDLIVFNPLMDIIRGQGIGELHPPLYFVLLHVWMRLTGDSAVSLRMLSALAAMLALPAFYHASRLMFGDRAGRIALILGALSPLQIYYAQEARNYMFSILFASWAVVGLLLIVRQKRYGWPIYVAASVGGLYTHYFVGLLLAAIHVWLIAYRPARQSWRQWLSADLAIAALFALQISQFLQKSQAVLGSFWIVRPNPAAPITTLTFLLFGATFPRGVDFIPITVLMAVLVIIALDILRKAPRRACPYWLFCAVTILVVLFGVMAVSYVRSPIYLDKSFALLSPLLLAGIAGGVAYARRPSPVPLLTVLLALLMIVGILNHALTPDPTKPPFRKMAADILAQPDALTTPILYLHDSLPPSMGYYAPVLTPLAHVVNLQDHSWLWPQGALYPQTWQRLGFMRSSREDIAQWLDGYHGRLRVFVSANLEPPELGTLRKLLQGPCTGHATNYGAFASVYEFACP